MFMNRKTWILLRWILLVLPNLIYRFNSISVKIPKNYFVDIDKLILKFIYRVKRPRIAQTMLKKNRELILPDLKTYYKSYSNQEVPTVVQWERTWVVSMRMQVPSLASLSGSGIQRCCELWCRQQTLLESHIAVAV